MNNLIELIPDTNVAIHVKCDLVASKTDHIDEELMEIVYKHSPNALILDMSDVEMIDSSGIGLLLSIHNYLKDRECPLSIVNLSEDIQDLFQRMRLDIHFDIKQTKKE